MDFQHDSPLSDSLGADQVEQLKALGICTIGEFLGATRGLQRYPSEDPSWEATFLHLRGCISSEFLEAYQSPLPLPPTGLLREP